MTSTIFVEAHVSTPRLHFQAANRYQTRRIDGLDPPRPVDAPTGDDLHHLGRSHHELWGELVSIVGEVAPRFGELAFHFSDPIPTSSDHIGARWPAGFLLDEKGPTERTVTARTDTTQQAISRYSGVGVRSVSSFAATAILTEKLPELPDFDLAAIVNLEMDDFMQALRLQGDLLKTEEELNALSDIRYEDPEKLAVAAAHMRSAISREFLEQSVEAIVTSSFSISHSAKLT